MLYRTYRYSQWDGSQRIFEFDADQLMDLLSDDILNHGDVMQALRDMMRRGLPDRDGQQMPGLRELMEQLKNQRREEWGYSVIEKFAPDLGLTQFQTEEMGRTWIAKAAMDDELGRLWEAGEIDHEAAGEIKAANEEQHQANLQGFLSTQQLEDYTAMVRSWRGGDK